MRRLQSMVLSGLVLTVLAGCRTVPEPRFVVVDRPGSAPIAPLLQGSALTILREPRYVRADRPASSPITPMLRGSSPWSPTLFADSQTESAPFSTVAPVLQPRPLFTGAQLQRRLASRPLARNTHPGPLYADGSVPTAVVRGSVVPQPKVSSSAAAALLSWESADELAKSGKLEQALRLYFHAVELEPALAGRAAGQAARLHDQLGQSEKAWRAYQTALLETPDDPDLLADVGNFYLRRGGASESERWFRMALERRPDHVKARESLARAMAARKEPPKNAQPVRSPAPILIHALASAGKALPPVNGDSRRSAYGAASAK